MLREGCHEIYRTEKINNLADFIHKIIKSPKQCARVYSQLVDLKGKNGGA